MPDHILEKHLGSDPNTPTGEVDLGEEHCIVAPRRVTLQVCELCPHLPPQPSPRTALPGVIMALSNASEAQDLAHDCCLPGRAGWTSRHAGSITSHATGFVHAGWHECLLLAPHDDNAFQFSRTPFPCRKNSSDSRSPRVIAVTLTNPGAPACASFQMSYLYQRRTSCPRVACRRCAS